MNDLTIYNQCAPQMKTGDGLLYKGGSILGRIIRIWTPFNHFNMVMRFDEYEGKTDRRWCMDARSSGLYPVLLSDYLQSYDGQVYWYPLKDEYDPVRQAIGCKMMEFAGRGYDFLGLIKNALGRVSVDLRKLFCSESGFVGYRDGGHIVTGDTAPRPGDMPKLGIFKDPLQII